MNIIIMISGPNQPYGGWSKDSTSVQDAATNWQHVEHEDATTQHPKVSRHKLGKQETSGDVQLTARRHKVRLGGVLLV